MAASSESAERLTQDKGGVGLVESREVHEVGLLSELVAEIGSKVSIRRHKGEEL